ncbi:hypothetical protein [Brachyspira pulli]|uniref:hypothetical protein n=1 Tax=Brachyspira pulli TaxID=310721 RepID=UPI00300462F7
MPIDNSYNFYFLLDDFNDNTYGSSYQEKMYFIVEAIKRIYWHFGAELGINYHSLYSALIRYSKDVYGLTRIKNVLYGKIDDLDNIIHYIKINSGLTIESLNPHLNKKLAYLTYHLACQKPFFANKLDRKLYVSDKAYYMVGSHFNEVVILSIVFHILEEANISLSLHNKEYFIHCLKNRNLSRSSLELLFESLIKSK